MLHRRFTATVSALCYATIAARCQPNYPRADFVHNQVVEFVLAQQRRLPDFLRWPIFTLTLLFDAFGLLQGGVLFHHQSPRDRWRQMQVWRRSPFSPCRDLMRFYENLTVFGWYTVPTADPSDRESAPSLSSSPT